MEMKTFLSLNSKTEIINDLNFLEIFIQLFLIFITISFGVISADIRCDLTLILLSIN